MNQEDKSRKEDKCSKIMDCPDYATESSIEKIFNWLEKYQLVLLFLGVWIGIFVISYLIKVIK